MLSLGRTLLSKRLLASALAVGLILAGASAALAQGVTTGAISGLVTAREDGSPLPGAQISAVHEPTGTRYSSVTRIDGRYNIAGVRVGGPYTVSVALDGFRSQEESGLNVALGQDLNVSFTLVLEEIEEAITVVGTSDPLINPTRTGATSNVSEALIESLPTVGRGLEDFARTNPFFTVGSENEDPDSISVAGRSSRYNNIQIDGAVNNDLFGLADTGTPGGQADTQPISIDAIQEIQLVLAPFDVRQGGFSGGGINAITKSGTNAFHGSVYGFTRDDSFFGGKSEKLGEFGKFSEDQYGFNLGGPLSRDKIFFFVNAETTDKEVPTGWSLDGSSGQTFADGRALNEAQRFRDILVNQYGFDPGGFAENIRSTPSDKIFARLDFNIGSSHNLTLRHNFVDAENDINRPGSFTYEFPSESYFFQNETNSTVAQLNSVFGPNSFNELRVTYQTIKDRRSGRDGVRFPWIEIENVIDEETGDDLGEFEAGTEPFSTRNALDQDIFEVTNDFTWIAGNHTFVLGTHNEFFTFDNLFIQNAFGSYEFSTLDDFAAGNSRRYNYTVVSPGQPDAQRFDVNQIGLYAGDTWSARSDLTLTYGLRVDIPYFPDTPSRNPFTEATYGVRTDELPDGKMLWSPRVGFNWDIGGQGIQQLRGGTGIFAGRTPYVWISNQYARTGIEQNFIQAFGVPFNPDPDNQPANVGGASTGEFNLIDPDFEFPQVWRINLAYDRELPWLGLVASVEAVRGESLKEIDYKDLNLVQTGETVPFDGRPIYTRLDRGVSGAYYITNTNEGESTNIAVKIERPYRGKWWGFVSYVWGDSKTVNDGTSSRAVSNFQFTESVDPNNVPVSTSDFEVEHRFNAAISYRTDWGGSRWPTTFSAFYNHQAGRPYSTIYGFQAFPSVNEDRYFANDLMYIPSGPDNVVITNGTWEELDAYISSDPCLDSHRGQIAPRNCSRAPWSHSLDVRIAQDIPIRNTRLQVTFDLLNLMNLLDRDSGLLRYAEFNSISPVDYEGTTADGRPIYGLNRIVSDPDADRFEIHNINSRWRAKLGLRWSF